MDVREPYFNAYRQFMDGFFKAENGKICEYDEIQPRSLYRKPFYREDQKDLVDMEARKFLFYDNQDWASVKRTNGRVEKITSSSKFNKFFSKEKNNHLNLKSQKLM